MALAPVLALPLRKMIANNSVSVKACAPLVRSFSRGRSCSGQCLMVLSEAMKPPPVGRPAVSPTLVARTVYHSVCALVHYAKRKAFQILTLRVMKAHGMVDGMAESFNYGDFAAGVDGGCEDDLLK